MLFIKFIGPKHEIRKNNKVIFDFEIFSGIYQPQKQEKDAEERKIKEARKLERKRIKMEERARECEIREKEREERNCCQRCRTRYI